MAETFNQRLEKLTQEKLDAAIERETQSMVNGGLRDFPQYRHVAGRIGGLQLAKSLLGEALSECSKQ